MVAVAKKKSKKSPKSKGVPKATSALAPIETLPGVQSAGVEVVIDLDDLLIDEGPNRAATEDDAAIEELARSMARHGQLQNIGVTWCNPKTGGATVAESPRLVWGHRRVAAARRLGWKSLRATQRDFTTEQEIIVARGVENFQRRELTPVDEALVVAHIVDVYETQLALGPTAEPPEGEQPNLPVSAKHAAAARAGAVKKAAEYFAKSETWVRDRAFLARLGETERELVATGRLPLAHAREIVKVADPNRRADLAEEFAGDKNGEFAATDLEEVREAVSKELFTLAQVPWKLDVAFAGLPACVECPANSANQPGLFEHGVQACSSVADSKSYLGGGSVNKEPAAGICTSPECYKKKSATANRAVATAAGRVVREIKAAPKKGRDAVQREAVGKAAPAFVSPSTVAGQVKAKLEAKPAAKSKTTAYKPYTSSPQDAAKSKLRQAMSDRCNKIEKSVGSHFRNHPLSWAAFKVFMEHPLSRKTQDYSGKDKTTETPGFKRLLQLLADPSLANIEELAKGCNRGLDLFNDWYDGPSGLAEAVAQAIGIDVAAELGPRPTLEDFLAEGKSAKGGKGKARSAAGGDAEEGDVE